MKRINYFWLFFFVSMLIYQPASCQTLRASSDDNKFHQVNEKVLQKFSEFPIVAIGEIHGSTLNHNWLATLVREKDFPKRVNNILVEWGTSKHQKTMDDYVNGKNVPDSQLKKCWRETTELIVWNNPIYASFFQEIRKINMALPLHSRVRVLLGDPAYEETFIIERDQNAFQVVEREVLGKNQTALIIYGNMHFQRSDIFFNYDTVRRNLVQKLEARYPNKTFTIWNGLNTNDSSTETILQKEKVKAPALLLTSNTSLGNLDFSVFYPYNIPRFDSKGTRQLASSQYRLKPMKENFDAILYLSTWEELNHSDPLPSYVYDDTLYLNELIRKASARKQEFGFKLNMLKFEKVKRSVLFKRFAEALPTGDLTKINATYKELKKHNPDFIASFGIGLAAYDLLENRKYKPAIYAFNLALIEYPNDAYVHAGLGDTYAAIGEKNKAAKTYAEALRLDPNFFEVKTKLEALKSVK